ncbi:MAG TPA: DUF1684 domain-containing protein [Puia sp.]|jgi:hypothetical protein|nr:DUF1684 domain-containing protein [Puia sp.]
MKKVIVFFFPFLGVIAFAQNDNSSYKDSLQKFRQDYIHTHDVVKGSDTVFLKFFPIDEAYRVYADFEKVNDEAGFSMNTSSGKIHKYFKYGKVTFMLKNKTYHLFIYQSERLLKTEKYKDYLLLPFTDSTSGNESHGSGRYVDFRTGDIHNNLLEIDFNKAYNPSCAYEAGYSCPIPPKENDLELAVNAGEKLYGKPYNK